jgi:autotransporter-associated beta strand protein
MTKTTRVAAFVAAGIGMLPAVSARAQLPSGGPWALRFADEFNDTYAGNATGLDPDKWNPAYPWGRVHNYPAYIRDENIKVNTNDNGLLQLWARRENFGGQPFTSGAVNSNGHLNFALTGQAGYMEARMKMPSFLGAWPAFWSLQEGWPPEIDVMEFVRNGPGSPNTSPNNYVANVHFRNATGQNASSWSGFKDAGAGDLTAAFHNYGVRWTDSTLTWYLDGRQFHSYTGPAAIAQMQRMYLILNLGVGGWPGDPPAGENVNKSFDIDWVRVWQTSDPAQSTYVGPAGSQNWDVAAHWTSGAPKLSSTTAVFGNLAGGTSATLDWADDKTVRGLMFRTNSSYRIGFADDLLTLSNWDTSASTIPEALIDVQVAPGAAAQGTQTIASRVELHSNTRVKNATANVLTFLGDVHGDGGLTLDSGKTRFNGAVFHRGGTNVVGSADATFAKGLGTPGSTVQVGTTGGSNSTLRLVPGVTTVAADHLRLGDAGGSGTLLQSGGAVTVTGGEVWVGQGAGSTGTYSEAAGSLTVSNWLAVGRQGGTGSFTLGGSAALNKLGPNHIILGSLGGTGTFTQTGGTVNVQSGNVLLGEDAGATGTYTITGGAAALGDVVLSQRGTGNGTFNLDGGTVTANRVRRAGTGTGTFNFNGGTLRAAGSTSAFMQGLSAASVKAGGARVDTAGNNVTISQRLLDGGGGAGGGGLTKLGAGTLTLSARNTYTGRTTVAGGTLAFGASQRLGVLDIGAGTSAAIAPGAAGTLVMDSLSIAGGPGAWAATLDLAGGAAAVDYAGGSPSPLQTIADQVRSGLRGGGGITSSIADTTSIGVGYAESAFALGPAGGTFGGETVDGTTVLIRPVRYGDADLDGVVGADDLLALRRHLGATGDRAVWQNGDFNYDGRVSAPDLVLLRRNYGGTMPTLAPATFAAQLTAVPEPGTAGVVLLGLAALALRRRGRA